MSKDKKKENMNEELKQEEIVTEAEENEAEAQTAEAAEPAEEAKPEEKKEEKAEEEDLTTRYMRLAADFQNFRKRTEKERGEAYDIATQRVMMQLLDVIDNFERAMANAPQDDKFAEGMQLILKQLLGILEKNEVREIEAQGKPFDPNFHNAVIQEHVEGAESGTITKVLQKGYMLKNKVIRPSMVGVAE